MNHNHLYVALVAVMFLGIAYVFNTFPRSEVSLLEKRDLATFPQFSPERLADGSFTAEVSSWYSDSEPFREELMSMSMYLKHGIRLDTGSDNIVFHAAESAGEETAAEEVPAEEPKETMEPEEVLPENPMAADKAKIANAGILIVGTGENVRALMAFGGGPKCGIKFAKMLNNYQRELGGRLHVYNMAVPTSIEFYCPDKVRGKYKSQDTAIRALNEALDDSVKAVDAVHALRQNIDKDIYLRTDHHWTPLGAFFAAQEFARVAGVPFPPLSQYTQKVIHGYVGSMYGFSGDVALKKAPEDFVYYEPQDVEYSTTFIDFTIDKNYRIIKESKPHKGAFFYRFKDGSSGAYCAVMGGDQRIVEVKTSTGNGRRLLIMKDSFGNMVPPFLFHSFEEVHVIDFRYFNKDLHKYVDDHHITDLLFVNNMFNVANPSTVKAYQRLLQHRNDAGGHGKAKIDSAGLKKETSSTHHSE